MNKKNNSKKKQKISSARWLDRQNNDPFVLLAKKNGYRSRASFKILEIDEKFNIFKKGQKVIDLGSAPGGWSQVIVDKVGRGNIVAVDILEMKNIDGVTFIQTNFLSPNIEINETFDIVMSDMAMNTIGDKSLDHMRTMQLVEKAFDFAVKNLKENGIFITKIFQGKEEPNFFLNCKKYFKDVRRFKPESSRKQSVEIYIIAQNFKKL